MSIFSNATRGLASSLIGVMGRPVTVTYRSPTAAYDPATGVTIAETTATAMGMIAPYETFIRSGFKKEAGLDIVQGDLMGVISALGTDGNPITAPHANDRITSGSNTYSIVAVAPHSPSGVDQMYLCTMKGGQ